MYKNSKSSKLLCKVKRMFSLLVNNLHRNLHITFLTNVTKIFFEEINFKYMQLNLHIPLYYR